MKMDTSLHQRLEQQLRLAPQIIQSIEILQLNSLDLLDLVKQELCENEVLEEVAEKGKLDPLVEACGDPPARAADDDIEHMESLGDWTDYFKRRKNLSGDGDSDKKLEAMQNTAARPTNLRESLETDLRLLEAEPRLKELAARIIQCLDDNGYLNEPLEELAKTLGGDAPIEDIEAALRLIQQLEPKGVGARNLQECLLLQLDPADSKFGLKKRLLTEHFGDLSKNRLPKIAKEINESLESLKSTLSEMASLDPSPGSTVGQERAHYIHPDVLLEWTDGGYVVTLTDGHIPRLQLAPRYLRMVEKETSNTQLRDYLRKKVDSARWLIESIEQRQDTLYRVACEIFKHQRDFLDHGVANLRPLKMQNVADALGVHVSTVSRAVSNKYVQTHRGIFALKFFFSGSSGGNGTAELESRASVRGFVEDMIKNEDKRNPLSDDEIAEKIHAMGLPIARRTVTKYRKAMRIPASRQRRVY